MPMAPLMICSGCSGFREAPRGTQRVPLGFASVDELSSLAEKNG